MYLDVLQTDQWLPQLVYSDIGYDQDEEEGLNGFFDLNGFGSTRFAVNLGSTFVFAIGLMAFHLLLITTKLITTGCSKR